jgi:hypothetical protein
MILMLLLISGALGYVLWPIRNLILGLLSRLLL